MAQLPPMFLEKLHLPNPSEEAEGPPWASPYITGIPFQKKGGC